MKSYATFFIIAVMILALASSLLTRDRSRKHDAPAEVIEVKEVAEAGAPDSGVEGGVAVVAVDAGPMGPVKPAEKPLRVAGLGWELVAPGAALIPAGGGQPAAPAPPIELAPETTLDAVEQRLARGGADAQGADIAVLPLPAFVASYERLRALEPKAFLVVGFSHGREEVRASGGGLLRAPPAADEVKLVALSPATAADANAKAAGSESATILGLFALDTLGVAPSRIKIVAPGTAEAKSATFAAVVKGVADERKVSFSSADAAYLIPIVAIAPKAVIDGREAQLREWSKAWLEGEVRTKADVPSLARRLASKEGLPFAQSVGGAPEALVLVERLGQIENATLDRQTSLMGPLAAKFPVSLESLSTKTWSLARGGGLTNAAAPDPLPIDARVVATIAPPPKDTPPSAPADVDGGAGGFGPIPSGAVALLQYRASEGDNDRVAAQIYFLSGVFPTAAFKIAAKGGAKAAAALATATKEKGVAATRLGTVAGEPAGLFAATDILAPP